jgi:hypothetical protein
MLAAIMLLCACTDGSRPASESEPGGPSPVVVEPSPAQPATSTAEAELDRTIWDCEWSIVVFWGPNLHWVHRDVAMAAMGTNTLYTREDFELSYGADRSFSAALRRREYPNGQRGPETGDGPLQPYTYVIDGRQLTINAQHWTDGPLECTAGCYEQDFIDFMDERYGMRTDASTLAEKMRAGDCGG